jgi:hypothetical protein
MKIQSTSRRVCLKFLFLAVSALLLAGCSSSDTGAASGGETGSGVEYSIPPGWIMETPSSGLRRGQYRLPRADGDGEDAELAVFFFEGQGGSIQANIKRWIGQFTQEAGEEAQIEDRTVNGVKVTIVDVSGTYAASSGPMMASGVPKPNFRMLGAIVDTTRGPWFFKLTGPANTVAKWAGSFDEFVGSMVVR